MPKVVGIKFNNNPKTYYFAPEEYELSEGTAVIVETAKGVEYGVVSFSVMDVEEDKIVPPLKGIMRLATAEDCDLNKRLAEKRDANFSAVQEKILASGLNMKLVNIEYTFEGNKLIVYFTADGRVDFRDLVRELASAFHTRIELRQIGARDECRMLGGVAPCGRVCCCAAHMPDYAHVSIKMAKTQNLSLNPAKISGLCGRLMCCLSYENAHYAETNKKMPKLGSLATTIDGKSGVVVSINQLKETVKIKVEDKETYEFFEYPLADITNMAKNVEVEEVEKPEKLDDELKSLID